MSFKRMLRPYMVSAAIIAITTFCLGSYVIPKGSVTRLNFEDKYYKPRKSTTAAIFSWRSIRESLLYRAL